MRWLLLLFFLPLSSFTQTLKIELFFDQNVSTLLPEALQKLKHLKSDPDSLVIRSVTAYTDRTGSRSVNNPLAESRMNVVLAHLNSAGLNVESATAPAEKYPDNALRTDDLAYWRRVDIVYEYIYDSTNLVFNGVPISAHFDSKKPSAIPLRLEFHPGSDSLMTYSVPEIEKLFHFLKYNEKVNVFIRGHVCCTDGMEVSEKRAKAVYDYLTKNEIDSSRLNFKGFSNTIPLIYPEITDEDSQRNRRVDIIFKLK
jgi:outer membrane protein OmpA-like peptidoglycan-associated protein